MTLDQWSFILDNKHSSYFNHKYGIYIEDYLNNKLLREAMKVTALVKINVEGK